MIAALDVLIFCSLVRTGYIGYSVTVVPTFAPNQHSLNWAANETCHITSMPNGCDVRPRKQRLHKTERAVRQSRYRKKSSSSGML